MKKKIKGFMLVLLLLSSTFLNSSIGYANFEGYKSNCVTEVPSDNSKGEKNNTSSDGGSEGGSWEAEGTKAHEIAQNMWNYWKAKGFSGSAIAGVMGNVAHEGGFDIPDRAEGHYGGTSKENGISEGNVPSVGAGYPVGKSGQPEGGAGHYQFTPYSKFAPIGDAKWKSTEEQSDFVWSSEVGKAGWLNEYIHLDSVETAVAMWFNKYERGQSLNPAKVTSGKKSYEIFGGANIKGDSALANATATAEKGEQEDKERKEKANGCYETSSDSKSSNGSAGKIIDFAKEIKGYFSYALIHGEANIGSVENIKKDGITDCSGFVWLVLARTGYKVPNDMAWFTGSMEADAKGSHEWLEEIKASEAKAGDIVIVNTGDGTGGAGHTAILTEDWKENEADAKNTTMIIQMGGDPSASGVNESSFVGGFLSLVDGTFGAHTITFARPIKK